MSWTKVTVDFIDALPPSQRHTVVMVVVDCLLKYAHFVPMQHPYTALIIAKAFISQIVHLHGVPISIISDWDSVFLSKFWRNLFQLQGTKLCMSSSYHPQTEVLNWTLEQYLCCFAHEQPKKWLEWIPWAEDSYNTAVHSSNKISPFEAVYGVAPPTLFSYIPSTLNAQVVD